MSEQTRSTNKTKFETGDVPTQSDFIDLLDSIFMFQSDTLEKIPQGTNRRWVTPNQISTWDSKSDTGHGHAISDVSGLGTSLNAKQPMKTPLFFDIGQLPTIKLNDGFTATRGELSQAGVNIKTGTTGKMNSDRYTVFLTNTTGSDSDVIVDFGFVNIFGATFEEQHAGVITVPTESGFILDGSFTLDTNGDWIFVGRVEVKEL